MNSLNSYPKVYAIGHPNIKELFLDDIVVQEKIDGSQISFGIYDGELKVRSKNKELDIDNPEKMFKKAVEQIKTLDLIPEWTYRGEYLQKPKHNTLEYSRVPEKNIVIFDINTELETYLNATSIQAHCKDIGLESVKTYPLVFLSDAENVKALLENDSMLGGTKIEGVVIKNYKRFGKDKKVLMGKYVSEAFKEIHGKEWKKKNPSIGDIVVDIGKELKTEARWNKAVQHLETELTNTPKDIGKLIQEVKQDIKTEAEEYIKDRLYKYAIDKILRIAAAGFPEWYKNRLLEKSFEEEV